MIIRTIEFLDVKIYSFLSKVKRLKGIKRLMPRQYYLEIAQCKQRIELLEKRIDDLLKSNLPTPMSVNESLKLIANKKLSVGRYGDGEFRLMYEPGHSLYFQKNEPDLIK